MRPTHPTDGIELIGSVQITPALDRDETELLTTIAAASFRAAVDDVPSGLVSQLAPGHPEGPNCWVTCEDGCCLEINAGGFAIVGAMEPWLQYIVGTLLSHHAFEGALMLWDCADRTFTALAAEGTRVRRRPILANAGARGRRASRPRLVPST